MSAPQVLRLDQVAELLQLSPKTVYRLVARGKLRRVAGIRHVRVTSKAIEEYLDGK